MLHVYQNEEGANSHRSRMRFFEIVKANKNNNFIVMSDIGFDLWYKEAIEHGDVMFYRPSSLDETMKVLVNAPEGSQVILAVFEMFAMSLARQSSDWQNEYFRVLDQTMPKLKRIINENKLTVHLFARRVPFSLMAPADFVRKITDGDDVILKDRYRTV